MPTDDGLDRYDVQVIAFREEWAKLAVVAAHRHMTVIDLIDVRHPAVPPAERW